MNILGKLILNGVANTLSGYTEEVSDTGGLYDDAVACKEALRQHGISAHVVAGTKSGICIVKPEDLEKANKLMKGGMKR